jgi:phosphoenolpyruvate---glycerone phosphotransferase subunit DhaL
MPPTLTTISIRWAIVQLKKKIDACAWELNELDGALGDGDLGVTMANGMRKLVEELPSLPEDLGMTFAQCSQVFTKVTASTYGTLLATGMLAAAKLTRGKTSLPWTEISPLLTAAVQAMSNRGKARLGDKTVLDALNAASKATEGIDDPTILVGRANQAVAATIAEFRDRPFCQGRARIFGEKGLGLDDPGMVALKRMIEGLA